MAKDLTTWNPDDESFWAKTGKKIAYRNLIISIPCLLCGFAIWIYWSMITVQMLKLGFAFTKQQLFTLNAIAGLSGATLRIPSSFLVRIAGGRNTIFLTTALLIIPAFFTGVALQNINTPLVVFQLLALLCGIGGGNFASSMSNITAFFPKREQGTALGLNAGLGNFGVTTMQILVPLVMIFGIFGGQFMELTSPSGTLIGKLAAGTHIFIHNAGYVWLLLLVPLAIIAFFGMNNISEKGQFDNTFACIIKILALTILGLVTSGIGVWMLLPKAVGGLAINKWIVLGSVIILTLVLLTLFPGDTSKNIRQQYQIFKNKHTWVMTVIYTMTFGSFIGFSASLALSIESIFGFSHVMNPDGTMANIVNPNAPSALMYAWTGPFIGAIIRPVGGWLSDKFGGAKITQIISFMMVACAIAIAYYMKLAYASVTPEQYFIPFFVLFLVMFFASGVGNGSTFRTVAVVFGRGAGPVLGWTSAIAAYGSFVIPQIMGEQITAMTPEKAMYGLAIFYVVCIMLNYSFYLRKKSEFVNP